MHTHCGAAKLGPATIDVFFGSSQTCKIPQQHEWEREMQTESSRRWKSMKMTKTEVVWLKSAGLKSFMRSAKLNVITHTSLDLPPHPTYSFSLFILHWNCHSALKYSCPGSEKWMHLPKGAEVEREKLVVSIDTLSWWKWQRALSQAVAPGDLDDMTAPCGGTAVVVCNSARAVWFVCASVHWMWSSEKIKVKSCTFKEIGSKKTTFD